MQSTHETIIMPFYNLSYSLLGCTTCGANVRSKLAFFNLSLHSDELYSHALHYRVPTYLDPTVFKLRAAVTALHL